MFPENLDLQLHDVLHWIDATRPTRLAVVMDRNTEKHCLPLLTPLLPPHTEFLCMSVVGESVKSIEHALALWTQLDHAGFDRNSALIGLGGGTITDLTAFVASTYLRGIPFWLIPTTLLGMVDAACIVFWVSHCFLIASLPPQAEVPFADTGCKVSLLLEQGGNRGTAFLDQGW